MVRDLMLESGVLDRIELEKYADTRFAEAAKIQTAWSFESGGEHAE